MVCDNPVAGTYPLYYDPIFDSNTLIVEALVMVSIGATVGSTKSVTITVDYGMNGVDNTSTLWFNVGTPASLVFMVKFKVWSLWIFVFLLSRALSCFIFTFTVSTFPPFLIPTILSGLMARPLCRTYIKALPSIQTSLMLSFLAQVTLVTHAMSSSQPINVMVSNHIKFRGVTLDSNLKLDLYITALSSLFPFPCPSLYSIGSIRWHCFYFRCWILLISTIQPSRFAAALTVDRCCFTHLVMLRLCESIRACSTYIKYIAKVVIGSCPIDYFISRLQTLH